MFQLRPYQSQAVDSIRQSYLSKFRSPLLVLPTGAGKTVVFSHIAAGTASRGKIVWIIVHRIELLRQTSDKLSQFGVRHGIVNPNYTPDVTAKVQVASVQTITRRLDKLPAPDFIIFDEAHHTNASTWRNIVDFHSNAYRLGVTATPIRGDGRGLGMDVGGIFDDIVIGPQIRELINWGYLVEPLIYAPREQLDFSSVKTVKGDFDSKASAAIVDKPKITGDAVDHYRKLCPGTPAVAFCQNVNHAMNVAAAFRSAGFRSYYVDGKMDDDERKTILSGLGNGSVDVVASCDIISEGTDIPGIGCAILLRPTQSVGLYIQQVGRALRTTDGKSRAIILDHVGNVIRHGLPDDDREWSLIGADKRKKCGNSEPDIRVSQCPSCYNIHSPSAKCPICGHEYRVDPEDDLPEVHAGDLVEMTAEQKDRLKRIRWSEEKNAKSFEDFQRIGKERGYKDGWAGYRYALYKKKNGIVEKSPEPSPVTLNPETFSAGITWDEYSKSRGFIDVLNDDEEIEDDLM